MIQSDRVKSTYAAAPYGRLTLSSLITIQSHPIRGCILSSKHTSCARSFYNALMQLVMHCDSIAVISYQTQIYCTYSPNIRRAAPAPPCPLAGDLWPLELCCCCCLEPRTLYPLSMSLPSAPSDSPVWSAREKIK